MQGGRPTIRPKWLRPTLPRWCWHWRNGAAAILRTSHGSIHPRKLRSARRGKCWRRWTRWMKPAGLRRVAASSRNCRSTRKVRRPCCSGPSMAQPNRPRGWRCCCRNAGWVVRGRIWKRASRAGMPIAVAGPMPVASWPGDGPSVRPVLPVRVRPAMRRRLRSCWRLGGPNSLPSGAMPAVNSGSRQAAGGSSLTRFPRSPARRSWSSAMRKGKRRARG